MTIAISDRIGCDYIQQVRAQLPHAIVDEEWQTADQATITVKQNGRLISTLYPQKRNYVVSMMPMTEVGIHTSLLNEMYVALGEPITADNGQTDINTWAVRVYVKPMVRWIWLGAIIMALGAFIAIIDKRYRLSKVQSIRRNDTGALS